MRTKHLLMALALPTVFAACTADDILEQGSNVNNMAARKAVGEISFVNSDIQSRLVFDNGLKWTAEDKLGAALMDEWNTGTDKDATKNYDIVNKIYSNYQYDYDGTGFSNGNAVLVEGNYFVYAQFNKDQKRSGLAYSIEANQTTGTGYDAWYKNQFFLDHIFVKQGDSQVGVNVLPVFPKVNMSIAYEGATSGIEVRKVIVKDIDETKGFSLNGTINPASTTVNYNALANVTATGVEGKKFKAADYTVTTGTLADVFNAYKKALKDYADGVFTLGEDETISEFVSPNVVAFLSAEKSESMTLNYTTPAASVKGVMVLPLSETHDTEDLVFEIYTNKGLVTLAGTATVMSTQMDFAQYTLAEDGTTHIYGKPYAEENVANTLIGIAEENIRFNGGIKAAFLDGMTADALQKVEIGFKENAILVPNTLTVSNTEELKYYLTNWYTGKKNQIVDTKNTVTIVAAPGEGQKVEIDNAVLAFINGANNPSLKFDGVIEIKAGTSADAINKIVEGTNLSVINNAAQTWTVAREFTNLTNKGTLTVGTGAQGETAVYTVDGSIVNEGTLTINKTLAGANSVYNAGTLNVNAALDALVNGAKEAAPAEDEIVAAAVANLNGGKTITTLANYATVNVANAVVGALTNNATVNANGAFKVTGTSVNNATVTIAATSTMVVTGRFENAKDATITNNKSLNVSKGGVLTNNGKVVNMTNAEASCNADGSKFINNGEIDARTKSITLVSKNSLGAEILVADNTALVTIPGDAYDPELRAGRVTFVIDEAADMAVIPTCANSLRVTVSPINLTDLEAAMKGGTKHIEFRSKEDMTITYYSKKNSTTGIEEKHTVFDNVYFNADGAESEVRFYTNGNLTAKNSLSVSENAMVIVNNNMNYEGTPSNVKNAGRLYVIGSLNYKYIPEPKDASGLAFMGNVYCTGGELANIEWADMSKAEITDKITEVVAVDADDITNALTDGIANILLTGEIALTSELQINKNVTIKGGTISGETVNVSAETVKFEGVTFSGANGVDASSIVWAGGKNITIEGCTFQPGYNWDAIQMGNFADNAIVVIKNNTFVAPTTANAEGSYLHIVATTEGDISSTAKVTIEGNTFGSFEKFADNPIKCYGLSKFSQWIVGKNTFASAYVAETQGNMKNIQVMIGKGDKTSNNYYSVRYGQKDSYDAFVGAEVKALVD